MLGGFGIGLKRRDDRFRAHLTGCCSKIANMCRATAFIRRTGPIDLAQAIRTLNDGPPRASDVGARTGLRVHCANITVTPALSMWIGAVD